MNKKIFAYSLMGVFVIALAAAALVPYLSNTVTVVVDAESPLVLSGVDFNTSTDYTLIVKDFSLTNNAGVPIYTIIETSISADNGVEFNDTDVGIEFKVLKIGLDMPNIDYCDAGGGEWNLTESYCYWDASTDKAYSGVVDGVYYVQMGDGSVPIKADSTMNGRLKLQFKTSIAPANYTIATTAMTIDGSQNLA